MRNQIIISLSLFLFLSGIHFLLQGQNRSTEEMLAAQYLQNGEFDKAVILYEELFEKKQDPINYHALLSCYIGLNDYDMAERFIKKLIKQNPGNYRYEVDLGWVYERSGDISKAEKQFRGLINKLPASPNSVIDLSNAFRIRGKVDYQLQTFLKGRSLLKNSTPFNIQIAQIYEFQGNYPEMMNEYIDFIDLSESNIDMVQGILQGALQNDPEGGKTEALRQVLLFRTQKNASNTLYVEMLLWLSLQQKDFETALIQAKALDRRLGRDGDLVFSVGSLSLSNQNFDVAIKAFNIIVEKGFDNPYYTDGRIGLLDANFQKLNALYERDKEAFAKLEEDYHATLEDLGYHSGTIGLVRNLARIKAVYLDKVEESIELLNKAIKLPGATPRMQAECKIELADVYLIQGEVWEAALLYAQVDKAFKEDPLGHEAKFKNARLSFYIGEFEWAKAQLDILKAATSKLIANDAMELSLLIQDHTSYNGEPEALKIFARADMLQVMMLYDKALLTLDSIPAKYPFIDLNANVLFRKAEIALKTGDYKKADECLEALFQKHPSSVLADLSLFKRAEINETLLDNKPLAMELYQKLMVDFPGSLYVTQARIRFRSLRGDVL